MQQTENLAPHVQEIARALPNKLDANAIEEELRRYLEYGVPLAKAKSDIVRMHGGSLTAGEKKVNTLMPEDKGVEIAGLILTVNPKEITVKGQPKQIFYGYFKDDTGKTSYTAWKDHNLQPGQKVRIKNAYAKKGFREGVDLQLGDYSIVTIVESLPFEVKEDFVSGGGSASGGSFAFSRAPAELKIRDLAEGQSSVTITARVLDLREKTISTANGQKTLVEGELADETGRASFSAWEPEKLPAEFKENAVVRVAGAYVRAFRGVPQLNFGQYATIDVRPGHELPTSDALRAPTKRDLADLEAKGGGQGVVVEGVVLEVKKGSGLIFRCSQPGCSRVLQNRTCAIHPQKQEGLPDLRIKAVLDDGLGAATFFVGREGTEKVLGKTLAQCQQQARDAMTVDVVHEDLDRMLASKRVLVRGNALTGDFGLQILASGLEFAPEKDVVAEAEALMGRLAGLMTEVGA